MKYQNFSRFGEKNLFGREINMKPGNSGGSSSQHSPKATALKAAAKFTGGPECDMLELRSVLPVLPFYQ